MNKNMELWNQLQDTPQEARKEFQRQGGFKGTSINPTWLRRRLTEVFGPGGWTCTITDSGFQHDPATNNTIHYCNVRLRVNFKGEWIEHEGVGVTALVNQTAKGDRINDECCKMSYTDALGNAAQNLGIGADIRGFWTDKYLMESDVGEPKQAKPRGAAAIKAAAGLRPTPDQMKAAMEEGGVSPATLKKYMASVYGTQDGRELDDAALAQLVEATRTGVVADWAEREAA